MKAVKFIMEKIRDKPDMPYDRSAAEDIQVPFCCLQSISLCFICIFLNILVWCHASRILPHHFDIHILRFRIQRERNADYISAVCTMPVIAYGEIYFTVLNFSCSASIEESGFVSL